MNFLKLSLIGLTILCVGCSSLGQRAGRPPATTGSPEAKALFHRLKSRNVALHTFKSTGRLQIENDQGTQHARFMSAGHKNEKLRLEILGGTGQPVVSFADDGDRIYLISHTENRFYSKRSTGVNLKKLIGLTIGVSDCLDLLAGRVPAEKDLLPLRIQADSEDSKILVLKSGEGAAITRIFIDETSGGIRQIEVFDTKGQLGYRAEFVRMQDVSGFEVPRELRLSDDARASIQIVLERFWPNAAVSEDLFMLSKPY